jgi:hypothetical protein
MPVGGLRSDDHNQFEAAITVIHFPRSAANRGKARMRMIPLHEYFSVRSTDAVGKPICAMGRTHAG